MARRTLSAAEQVKIEEQIAEAVCQSLADITSSQNVASFYAGLKNGILDTLVTLGIGEEERKEIERNGIEKGVEKYKRR